MFDDATTPDRVLTILMGSAAILVGGAFVLRDCRRLTVTAATLFAACACLFVNIGMMVHYMGDQGARNDSAILVTAFGLLAFIVGAAGRRPATVKQAAEGDAPSIFDGRHALWVTSVMVMSSSLIYFVLLGNFPLLSGLRDLAGSGELGGGLVNNYRNARDTYSGANGRYIPGQGLWEMFRYWGLPVVMIWSLVQGARRGGRAWRVLGVIALVVLVSTGQRWPFLLASGGLLAAGVIYLGWSMRRVLRAAVAAFCGLLVLTVLLGRDAAVGSDPVSQVSSGLGQIAGRIFVNQSYVPYLSYGMPRSALRADVGLTWVQNLLTFLPGPGESYPVTFAAMVIGERGGFTAPPDFFTEAWINMGPWMVIVCAIWGLLLSGLDISTRPDSLFVGGVKIFGGFALGASAISGITILLGVIIVFCICTVVFVLAGGEVRHSTAHLSRRMRGARGPALVRDVVKS